MDTIETLALLYQEQPFKYLFGDITTNEFYDVYWEKKPLFIERNDNDYYEPLFGHVDLDALLCSRKLYEGDIRIFKNENKIGFHRYSHLILGSENNHKIVQPAKAYNLYLTGHTLIFQNVNTYELGLANLLRALDKNTGFHSRCNIYVTPPDNRGFGKHWDHMCSIIVQLEGEKEWEIYEQQVNSPNPMMNPKNCHNRDPKLIYKKVLKQGDLLYVPRGFAHSPKTNDCHSVHANIAFKPIYSSELIQEFVKKIILTDVRARVGIHPIAGVVPQEMKDVITKGLTDFDWQDAYQQIVSSSIVDKRPVYTQWHKQPGNLLKQTEKSEYKIAPSIEWSYRTVGDHVIVSVNSMKIKIPGFQQQNVKSIRYNEGVLTHAQLPDGDEQEKKSLLADFVKVGILYIIEGEC